MKIPNLDNVHVIFHHQLPTKMCQDVDYWIGHIHVTGITKHAPGYTICKIYRGEELIGEGRADCSLSDNFNRVVGRKWSLHRALLENKKVSYEEFRAIVDYIRDLPTTKRYYERLSK